MFNQVILTGNLVRDPQYRTFANSDTQLLTFTLARQQKSKDGARDFGALFVDVNVWGASAVNLADVLCQGSWVTVGGILQMDHWKDRGGNDKSKLRLMARHIIVHAASKTKRDEHDHAMIDDANRGQSPSPDDSDDNDMGDEIPF